RLWVIEIASQKIHRASPEGLQVWEFGWSPDGKQFVGTDSDAPYEWAWYRNRLVRFPSEGGTAQTLYQSRRQVALPRWSPDASQIAFLSSTWSDRGVTAGDIFTIPASGGHARHVTAGAEASFGWMEWKGDNQSFIAVAHERGGMSFSEISASTGKRNTLWWGEVVFAESHWPRFSSTLASRDESSELKSGAAMTIAVVREDGNRPRDIWILQSTGENAVSWKQLTQLHPQTAEIEVATPESIRWRGADGWEMQGILVRPVGYQAGKKYPLVTWVHGGPTSASTFR